MLVLLPSAFDLRGERPCRRYLLSSDGSSNQNLIMQVLRTSFKQEILYWFNYSIKPTRLGMSTQYRLQETVVPIFDDGKIPCMPWMLLALYIYYLVIRCQWFPGVLLSRHLDRGLIQRLNFQRDPRLCYSQNSNHLGSHVEVFPII